MISTSATFKTAIRASSRKIKAKLIFLDKTINEVDLIELDSYLTDEEDFILGTANMDVMKIEISDDPLNPILYDFNNKEADVHLGVFLPDSTIEYYSLGKFTVEKSSKKDFKISLHLIDRMYKADKVYISNLTYPATLLQILVSAADQADITLTTTTFLNSNHIVNEEPVYEGITCRQVFAYIAELAGGYSRVNRDGLLTIKSLGSTPSVNVTGDHYIDWKKDESAQGIIDKLIVKNGEETASSGTGNNIYTIVDNIFVSNPGGIVDNIFSSISTINYKAGELNWIGDFSLDVGDMVTIDGEDTYILNRKLKYTGGLRETVKIPGKSNIERNSTGKPNTNLEIRDLKTKVKIISGEIEQVIENGVSKTEFQQTNETFSQRVTVIEENIENIELTPGPEGPQGVQGPPGQTTYTWIKYADTPTTGMSNFPDGKLYMGLAYNKTTATESSMYSDYTWALIKGANGSDGSQGIPGPAGSDGQTTYTWVKYADTETGSGMSDSPTGKRFVGMAFNKTTATKSTTASDYSWSPLYDNVKVGGRNLLISDTLNRLRDNMTEKTTKRLVGSGTYYFDFITELKPNTHYTASNKQIICDSTAQPNRLNILIYDEATSVLRQTVGILNSGSSITFTTATGVLPTDRVLFYVSGSTVANFDIDELKLEQGNIATDWTAAPEDDQAYIADAVNTTSTELHSAITQESDNIKLEVGRTFTSKSELETYKGEVATQFSQTTEDFLFQFSTISSTITETQQGNDTEFAEIKKYIRFEDGDIIIGESVNPITLRLENDILGFWQTGTRVAHFSNNKLYVTHGEFLNSLRLGSFSFTPRDNGNLSFGKVT